VLLGPIAGWIADRSDRRRLLIWLDLLRVGLMGAMAVAATVSGSPTVAIALAFAASAASTPYVPAITAMTPTVVPESALTAANALAGTVNYLSLVFGPALGTVAVVLGSPEVAFAINAASFAASGVAVAMTRPAPIRRLAYTPEPFVRRAVAGLGTVFSSGETTVLTGFFVGQAWIFGLESVLLVLAADSLLGVGATGYGWLLAAIGVGGLVAALGAGRISEVRTPTLLLVASMFAVGLPLASLSMIHHAWVAYVLLPLDGAGTLLTEVLAISALQRSLPEDKIARVFAAMDAFAFAGVIAGSLAAPLLVRWIGLEWALVVAGLSGPVATVVCSPWLRNVDRLARQRVAALGPTVEALARSPIFQGATRASLEMLASALTGVRVEPGRFVIREGEPATEFYVVNEGRLTVQTGDGAVLSSLGPGDHFGEVGILDGIPRTASVRAETTSSLFRIDAADFLGVVNKSPVVRGALHDVASSRLAQRGPLAVPPEPRDRRYRAEITPRVIRSDDDAPAPKAQGRMVDPEQAPSDSAGP
jgi:MFS family permease